MHGVIFKEFKEFIASTESSDVWDSIMEKSKMSSKVWLPIKHYSDSEIVALIVAYSELVNKPVQRVLEEFGFFVSPHLIEMYKFAIDPKWNSLDLIEFAEQKIHTLVRRNLEGAKPPILVVTRTGSKEITIKYNSERKLCHLLKGVVKGLSHYYKDVVSVNEVSCMHNNDEACVLVVVQSN